MKFLLFSTLTLILLACGSSSNTDKNTIDANEINSENEQISDEIIVDEAIDEDEQTIWAAYSGRLGLYDQQVIMEIGISGNKISGSYFYAKHQKVIHIEGSYDENSSRAKLIESYKGKTTGYLEFQIQKGELSGHWMKKQDAEEKEDFHATLLSIDKKEYSPKFEKYEDHHYISIFNGEDYDKSEVNNVLNVTHIGKGHFVFYYSVVGENAHMGSLEGLGYTNNQKSYFQDGDNCKLGFDFRGNSVEVTEIGDCQSYRGYHAYFNGLLKKKP